MHGTIASRLLRAGIACSFIAASSALAAFIPGAVYVFRVGDGSAALSSAATAAFIDVYRPDGTLIATYPLPTVVNGANRRLTVAGTATGEGLMTLSGDGNFIVFAGYDADVGTASVATSTTTLVNRVVGRLDSSFNLDTTTVLNSAFSAGNVRSAASVDGTAFWVSGSNSGVQYITLGAIGGTQILATPANGRALTIFAGQLYGSSGSTNFTNVYSIGSGTPTTSGQTATSLAGMPISGASPYQFVFSDSNTLYVADDVNGMEKWFGLGGSWTLQSFAPSPAPAIPRAISGYRLGSSYALFVANPTTLYTMIDDGVSTSPATTAIASAATNTAFRGVVAIPPVAPGFTASIAPSIFVHPRQAVTLNYNIVNTNAIDVAISVNDSLPPGTAYTGGALDTTCAGGTPSVAAGVVTFSGSVGAITACQISVELIVTAMGAFSDHIAGLHSSLGDVSNEVIFQVCPYGDFSCDGYADILWRKTDDGSILQWLMNGTTVFRANSLGAQGTTRVPKFLGDFNGDGSADIVWEDTDGTTWLTLLYGGTAQSDTMLVPCCTGWHVTQVGDFNGDGMSDLVWTHTDGSMQIWLMNGATAINAASFVPAGTGWSVIKLADLNGDGMADIIWQHTDGTVQAWLMDGLTPIALGSFVGAGSGWTVSLVGDLDGDGMQDLLWTNTDGSAQAWTMNGLTVTQVASVVPAGTGYVPAALGDLDADGKQDLLWFSTRDGTVIAWIMDVGLRAKAIASFTGVGNQYTVTHMLDLDRNGTADILWKHPDGTVQAWLMNGLVIQQIATLVSAPTPYVVVPPMP